MEDKKANIIATILILALVVVIIAARVSLKLSKTFYLIAGVDISLILAVICFLIIRSRYNKERKLLVSRFASEGRELRIEYSFLRKVAGVPTKFKLEDLEEATDGFRSLIGKGGSGSVFKGVLKDGSQVAVKRIEGEEKGEREFRSEVAAIASVQHKNLVRLYGYSSSTSANRPRFLVYDYIVNSSLDIWIFPDRGNRGRSGGGCLSWEQRYQVAIDVAKALAYLHHDCRSKILHLDVKPENILLDENFRAVVTDFGLSKLIARDEMESVMKQLAELNHVLHETKSDNAAQKEKIELLEKTIEAQRTDLEEYGRQVCIAKEEASKLENLVESIKSELEISQEEKTRALDNEKAATSNIQNLLDQRTSFIWFCSPSLYSGHD